MKKTSSLIPGFKVISKCIGFAFKYKIFIFIPVLGMLLVFSKVYFGHDLDNLRSMLVDPINEFDVFVFFVFCSFIFVFGISWVKE